MFNKKIAIMIASSFMMFAVSANDKCEKATEKVKVATEKANLICEKSTSILECVRARAEVRNLEYKQFDACLGK